MSRRAQVRQSSRGFFAVGIWHPKTEINVGTLWRTAAIYDAAFMFTVGLRYKEQASDTMKAPRHTPLFHFTDVDDLLAHLPFSCPLVGVEQAAQAVSLERFRHPDRAAYMLGAEDQGLPPKILAACHHVVEIPTPQPFCMNVAVAGSLILHDRFTNRPETSAAGAA